MSVIEPISGGTCYNSPIVSVVAINCFNEGSISNGNQIKTDIKYNIHDSEIEKREKGLQLVSFFHGIVYQLIVVAHSSVTWISILSCMLFFPVKNEETAWYLQLF